MLSGIGRWSVMVRRADHWKYVVLKCGCLATDDMAYVHLGQRGEYQDCSAHPDGKGRFGTQKIMRDATLADLQKWDECRELLKVVTDSEG